MVLDQFRVCPFTIYRDSMEQTPWSFKGLTTDSKQGNHPIVISTVWRALGQSMGDYSIAGMEDEETGWKISIERKSLADLYGTLLSGRDRFKRELAILARMQSAHVVVEADWSDILQYNPQHWSDHSEAKREAIRKSVRRSIVAWSIDFPTIHWWLMPGRRAAEVVAFRILYKFWERQNE